MKPYHIAWLKSHPHRSARWLARRLRDGFDVHHIDGDQDNNDPSNLILIEHTDHMRCHGMRNGVGRLAPRKRPEALELKLSRRARKAKAVEAAVPERIAARPIVGRIS